MAKTKTVKTKVKKGDIVFLDGPWGVVIGRLVSYNRKNKELTLEWPESVRRLAKYGGEEGIQSFRTVEEEQIKILTSNELFEKISSVIIMALMKQRRAIVRSVDNAIYGDFKIF